MLYIIFLSHLHDYNFIHFDQYLPIFPNLSSPDKNTSLCIYLLDF